MSHTPTGAPSPCPDSATLEALYHGRLPEDSLEAVAEHVATCPVCARGLSELQARSAASDSLLGRLRRCARTPALVAEDGCARLEAAARAIPVPPHDAGEGTFDDSAGPIAASPETATKSETTGRRTARALPVKVGPYAIVGLLGEGGMGVVYQARHTVFDRPAAVKMVLAGVHAGASALARFRTEGRASARLRHPHVVEIFDFGEHYGLPYYGMELLDGGSLAQKLRGEKHLAPRAAAELVAKLATGVEAAHRAGVLHRDLKPANVLLTAAGEPKVADFGLAKLLDQEHGHTQPDAVLGTASYMAPEQAEGRTRDIGPTTDVYGLGAVLYHALTGTPPFKDPSPTETRRQVAEDPPRPPRRLRPDVPPVLEAICLKCLEKDPARRYPTAQALADDLGRFLHGEPTQARPPRWWARPLVWARRHRVATGLVVLLLLGLVVLYERSPQRAVEAALRATARGDDVTLIGLTGPPAWHRLHVLKGASELAHVQLREARDGSFALDANVPCLLELLPETSCDSYRLLASIRHDESLVWWGSVGLFFGLAEEGTDAAAWRSGVHLKFRGFRSDLNRRGKPETKDNKTELFAFAGTRSGNHLHDRLCRERGIAFTPAGEGEKGVWHALEISITPDLIRASFDGKPAAEVAVRELEQELAAEVAQTPRLKDVKPRFPWRGGLGLYLDAGSASFRNVVLSPLPGG